MRIVIDLQGAQSESRFRGIGRYSMALAQGLARLRGEQEMLIALNGAFADTVEPIRAAFDGLLPQENILVWSAPQPTACLDPVNESRRRQAEACREAFLADLNPDWVVVTSLFEGFAQDAVTSIADDRRYRTAVVLYDLIPWIRAGTYLANEQLRRWYFNKIDHLRRADLLLAISESSGREAVDYLGFEAERVVNISTAAEDHFRPIPVSESDHRHLADTYGLERPFVMYTGGIDHRKNIEGLIEAYACLPEGLRARHQLAVVCSIQAPDRERLAKFARSVGLEDREVVFTGFVPEEDLLLLYNACELFVFPSWHEGFGLPALEAMQCGRPVLASNRSSLPEVVGREDALFDPYDAADIAVKIQRALTDEGFRTALAAHGLEQARKFSWDETARRAWAALAGAQTQTANVKPLRSLLPKGRPRLAFVSPLPPEQSGIADYSAELLRDLTRWYRIDVVLKDPQGLTDDYVRANCGVVSVEEFRAHAGRYDRVLYHFGNSEFHEHMFRLLAEIPGVVVLHDFFLSAIQACSEAHQWRPHAWINALLASHGYGAVADRFRASDTADVVFKYPANLPVLQDALGVIVHSEYNRGLAERWYGKGASRDWIRIPHLRVFEVEVQRKQARARLGLPKDALVVCAFGVLGPIKLNHRLLEAWLASKLAGDRKAQLVFVGMAAGEYGANIERRIRDAGVADRIRITGWVDSEAYRDWLAAADIAVQLRTLSRGETSGTVLDCMNFGLATIANAHGSFAELDPEAVWLLPDEFTDAQLIEALETLAADPERRRQLGSRAREIIRTQHNPRRCAEQYARAIEGFYTQAGQGAWGLVRRLAAMPDVNLAGVATHIARNHPPRPRRRQLLVDVSELVQRDARSGIQRVVRAILREWLEAPPDGFQVDPVYATADRQGYFYARRFTCRFLGIPDDWTEDDPVEVWPGDMFVGLDLQPVVIQAQVPIWQEWRRRGVRVFFIMYDLLPSQLPHCFSDEDRLMYLNWLNAITQSDGVLAISAAVSNELRAWLDTTNPERNRPLSIGWFHLGADLDQSVPTQGIPPDGEETLARLRAVPSFLMVGTIEPRKGYAQTLAAFESLWDTGQDINLVIVGKQGWMVEDLVERLRAHPERNKRLFWLEGISDEYLERIYAASTCLIAASEGEGFGLPLIEAAHHKLPIIARDIPVFREVAGEHAFYFRDFLEPETIAEAVQTWLKLWRQGAHPKSEGMPHLTWKESAAQLLDAVLNGARCEPWITRKDGVLRFWGNDPRLHSSFGRRRGRSIETSGQAGFLFWGPYMPLPKGRYRISVRGEAGHWCGREWLDVACDKGERKLVHLDLQARPAGPWAVEATLELATACSDLEIRLWVAEESRLRADSIEITELGAGKGAEGRSSTLAARSRDTEKNRLA